MSDEHGHLTVQTLLAVVLMMVFIISGSVFEKIHFHYLHESGLVMILGIVVALFMNAVDPLTSFAKTFDFNSEMFFTLILPPIIFGAGYNLRRKLFFKYIFYILLFGVIGTVINFMLVAPFTLIVNHAFGFGLTAKQDIFLSNGKLKPIKKPVASHRFRLLDEEVVNMELEEPISENSFTDTMGLPITSNSEITNELNDKNSEEASLPVEATESEVVVEDSAHSEHSSIEQNHESSHDSLISQSGVNQSPDKSNSQISPSPSGSISASGTTPTPAKPVTTSYTNTYVVFSTTEILLFAAVISATDAVAALAFIKEESDPKLFPILFGEGVVNDAVCIVLYQIIRSFLASGEGKKFLM